MASRKSPPSRLTRLSALLESRVGSLLVRTTVAALVFLLAGIVMRQARAYTYRLDDFRLGPASIEFQQLPAWADASVRWTLQPRMFQSLNVSIYDPEAERAVRAVVERHPLVREVRAVEVLYPNRARVDAVFRTPVAQVAVWVAGAGRKQVQRLRLLSDDGCLLPRGPYKAYLGRLPYDLPMITGITERVPLDPGEVWEDRTERVQEAVAASCVAARLYRDFRGYIRVTRIDVARFPAVDRTGGEVRLVISCPPIDRGGERVDRTVEWGRTERACRDVPREDGYDKKMGRLAHFLKSKHAPGYLDVRHDLLSSP